MKKTVIILLMLVFSSAIFAQDYTVFSVTGDIQYLKNGVFTKVKIGDTLDNSTYLRIPFEATIALRLPDNTQIAILGRQEGTIANLAPQRRVVRIGGTVAQTDTTPSRRTVAQIGTASARASDAAADLEFEE